MTGTALPRLGLVVAIVTILLAGSAVGQGIHGGTAPVFRPLITSERGTIPSERGDMPSLRDTLQYPRWETPYMPVPRFTNDLMPWTPSFSDTHGPQGYYDPQPMGPNDRPAYDGTFTDQQQGANWDRTLLGDQFFEFQKVDPFFSRLPLLPAPEATGGESDFHIRDSFGFLPYPAYEPPAPPQPRTSLTLLEMPDRPGGQRHLPRHPHHASQTTPPAKVPPGKVLSQPRGAVVQLVD